MKKFYILAAGMLLCGSAMAQQLRKAERVPSPGMDSENVVTANLNLAGNGLHKRLEYGQRTQQPGKPLGAPQKFANQSLSQLPTPDDAPQYIQDTPEGTFKQMVKGPCWSYAYNWMIGQIDAPSHGCLIDFIFGDDGKVYMRPVYSLVNNNCWLVGQTEGDEILFKFPQVANHFEYPGEFGETVAYDEHCLVVGFKEDEDGSGQGWYYPVEDQTFRFKIKEDGSLEAVNSEVLLGYCAWVNTLKDGTEVDPYWSWQYTGDNFTTLHEETNEVAEVPDNVKFEEWYLVGGIAARPLQIGFDGDNVYLKGLVSVEGLAETAIVGVKDDKAGTISFPTNQFMGIYKDIRCESWFVAGTAELIQDEDGSAYKIENKDALVFDYDSEKKIMRTDDCFVLAQTLEAPAYLGFINKPTIKYPDFNVEIKELLAPVISEYYPAEPDWGYPASMYVNIPMLDAEGNILKIENIYYNLLLDGEPWIFFADEYGLEEDMTDVPYTGVYSGDYFLYWLGDTEHSIEFNAEGFETLGVQYFYRQGDRVIASPVAYANGLGSAIGTEYNPAVKVERYTLDGIKAAAGARGILIEKAVLSDGSSSIRKVIVR